MLTIYVGEAAEEVEAEFQHPESGRMPRQVVEEFWAWYEKDRQQTVRTCTDTLINFIGEMIEDGRIDRRLVVIVTDNGRHIFDSDGILTSWPYGIFNY